MSRARRRLVNGIVLGLAILAILAGLIILKQWGSTWLNATLL